MATPTNIFIAYHAKDTEILDNLRAHLSPLERTEGVKIWYDGKVNAGSETLVEIRRAMSEADIILLLVSSNFIASDFCYDTIMTNAIAMHSEGKVKLIPVIIRNCMWDEMPFSHLRKLPLGDIPITSWNNPDEPYTQVARELKKLISLRQTSEPNVFKKKTRKRGRVLYRIPKKMQKGVASDCIIRIAPEDLPEDVFKEALKDADKAVVEDIRRIGKHMKVMLTDDSDKNAFSVRIKSRPEQVVEEDDYTEWQYEVTPLKQGIHKLLLTVSVSIILDEFGREYKDVVILDKEIEITTNEVDEIYDWSKAKENSHLLIVHSNVGKHQIENVIESSSNISTEIEDNKSNVISILRNHRRTLSTILLAIFFIPAITWAVEPSFVTPIILDVRYDETRQLSNERIAVKKDDKWGIVNKWGVASEATIYEQIKDYENDIIQVKKGGKWGALEKIDQTNDSWFKKVFNPKDRIIVPILADTIETIIDNKVQLLIGGDTMTLPILLVDTLSLSQVEKEIQFQVRSIYQAAEDKNFEITSILSKNINVLKQNKKTVGTTQEVDDPLNRLDKMKTDDSIERKKSSKLEKATNQINSEVTKRLDTSKNILDDTIEGKESEASRYFINKIDDNTPQGADISKDIREKSDSVKEKNYPKKIGQDEKEIKNDDKPHKNTNQVHDFYIVDFDVTSSGNNIQIDCIVSTKHPSDEVVVSTEYTIRSMEGEVLRFLGDDMSSIGIADISESESFSFDFPIDIPDTIIYRVCAEVNSGNNFLETDYTNNLVCSNIRVSKTVEFTLIPPVQEILDNMIFVEGGTFTMGCIEERDYFCYDKEKPAHPVTLSSFYISKYEVTQEQYEAIMGENPSHFKKCSRCPVEQIRWEEAQTFVKKLNQMTGEKFRLPTEAEWEYSARGGQKSKGFIYAGSDVIDEVAWYDENDYDQTNPVGEKAPNELGIYDMTGNVWEYCADWYAKDYYENSPANNPTGPNSEQTHRIARGCSWFYPDYECSVTNRFFFPLPSKSPFCGFRLAQTLE